MRCRSPECRIARRAPRDLESKFGARFSGRPTTEMFIKITPTHLVIRHKVPNDVIEMLDGAGEAVYKEVFTDGVRYFESPLYELKVNTATSPWQIDLTRDGKDGKKVVQLGLCEV